MMMYETPEQKARHDIDADLNAAGWIIQSRDELDLTAGRGVAIREFSMKHGFGSADHMLYLDRKAVGAVEAKAEGTLTGVEEQAAKYAAGLPDNLPAHKRPLPFLFESNGSVIYFTNGLDPTPRSRQVFCFPRPETLAELVGPPSFARAASAHRAGHRTAPARQTQPRPLLDQGQEPDRHRLAPLTRRDRE
jgi:type I restriction enzyme R subunit